MDLARATSVPEIPATAPQLSPIAVTFENRGDRLIGLGFVNGLLRFLTLGLYSFWAKTEVRRRLWSFTRLNGEPLEYSGTGRELFLGFLIIFGLVALPALLGGMALVLVFGADRSVLGAYQGALYLLFFLLLGNAIYRARRYRLSRTQWRGIRGALVGSPSGYGWMYFWTIAAPLAAIGIAAFVVSWATAPAVGGVIMAFGFIAALWVLPWRANALQARMTREMRFGDAPLAYDGTAGPLYRRYLYAWAGSAAALIAGVAATFGWALSRETLDIWRSIGTPPPARDILAAIFVWFLVFASIAVITASYRAAQVRHFARHTALGPARFRSEVTGRGFAWIVLSNWIIAGLGLFIGAAIGIALIVAFSEAPRAEDLAAGVRPEANVLQVVLFLAPIVVLTTAAATFAQFRSARYFLSRLGLDGDVDLAAIRQSGETGPKRGEGLAQVFDLDAF